MFSVLYLTRLFPFWDYSHGPCPLWNKRQAIKVKSGLTQWILVLNILKWIGYWRCMFQKNRWYRCFPSMIFRNVRNRRKVLDPRWSNSPESHRVQLLSRQLWTSDLIAQVAISLQKNKHATMTMIKIDTSRAARGGGGSFKNRKRIGEIGCCESRMTKRKHWWIWPTAEVSNWLTD